MGEVLQTPNLKEASFAVLLQLLGKGAIFPLDGTVLHSEQQLGKAGASSNPEGVVSSFTRGRVFVECIKTLL